MEEDIKILENMLNKQSSIYKINRRGNKEIKFEVNSNYYNAIENLLKDYKDLKLKERNRVLGRYVEIEVHDLINKVLSEDYIPKSKVKEKIEYYKECMKYKSEGTESKIIINVLEELLGEE